MLKEPPVKNCVLPAVRETSPLPVLPCPTWTLRPPAIEDASPVCKKMLPELLDRGPAMPVCTSRIPDLLDLPLPYPAAV